MYGVHSHPDGSLGNADMYAGISEETQIMWRYKL
jgi:hypothetical protein